jgi:hypothetical protein
VIGPFRKLHRILVTGLEVPDVLTSGDEDAGARRIEHRESLPLYAGAGGQHDVVGPAVRIEADVQAARS